MATLTTPTRSERAIADNAEPFPHVDVVTLFSGRWYCWNHWLKSMEAVVYPREKLHLWWYCNSRDPAFTANLTTHALRLAACGVAVRLTLDPNLAVSRNALRELQAGDAFPDDHCRVIAELYNRATLLTTHDLFFFEDDASVSSDAILRLQHACHDHGAGYAVARVHDRHSPSLFCWQLERKENGEYTAPGIEPTVGVHPIGLGGFTCTYLRRWAFAALSSPKFKPFAPPAWKPGLIAGSDMVLCMELDQLEIARVCDMSLKVDHWDSQGRPH